MFGSGEWRLGTDAIRYLNNNYYADPRLLPSLLYLFGILDHEEWPESQTYESDPEADYDEDVVIEEPEDDELVVEDAPDAEWEDLSPEEKEEDEDLNEF